MRRLSFPSPASLRAAVDLRVWLLALLLVWLWPADGLRAQAVPTVQAVPALTARVLDQTGTLNAAQRGALESKLADFEARKGTQLVVLMVATTQPEDIASYSNRVANTWKIGRRDVGDGVLLLVAKDDRALRIEVAKTLEGALPDLMARRIIDSAITPHFRTGDFAGGLVAGVDRIIAVVDGEALPAPAQQRQGASADRSPFGDGADLLMFLVFAVPIGSAVLRQVLGRKLGALATGAATGGMAMFFGLGVVVAVLAAVAGLVFALVAGLAPALSTGRGRGGFGRGGWRGGAGGGGWSGGGGGGFGGGGFGSGGGGDFGGGGASGKW